MRIYVCVPGKIFSDQSFQRKIRNELSRYLTKFYGDFLPSDIEFFSNSDGIDLYVMEPALYSNSETQIINTIQRIFKSPVNIKLNYQQLAPNFRPDNPPRVSELTVKSPDEASMRETDEIIKLAERYHAEKPFYTFEQVIVPEKIRKKVQEAVLMVSKKVREKIFEDWGLKHIVPRYVSALSFYGPPGTGKTMIAEAVASFLGKKIIRATYADIESKYHGEGPKMVKAIFFAAKREDAVLFIDEADSLLSKRLTNVQSGSEQAINSMRSQLLTSLEHFDGVVIFATNLVVNYDKAFISRVISIEIPPPDFEGRKAIWEQHIRGKDINIPLADDVNTDELARKYETNFYGREIKNSVIRACVATAAEQREMVTQNDFLSACQNIRTEAENVAGALDYSQNRQNIMRKIITY